MVFIWILTHAETRLFNKRIVEPEFGIVHFLNEIQDYESEWLFLFKQLSALANAGSNREVCTFQLKLFA